MKIFFFITAIILFSCGQEREKTQEVVLEEIPPDTPPKKTGAFQWDKWEKRRYYSNPDDTSGRVAKGHVTIDASYGDLDENGILDIAVITGLANEDSLRLAGKKPPRHLIVIKDQKELAFRNTKAIPCNNCCGTTDPYAGHLATTGKFIINEECLDNGKTRSEYRFYYHPELNDLLLDTIVTEFSANQDEHYTLDTMTKKDFGRISLKTFEMYKIKFAHLRKLSEPR